MPTVPATRPSRNGPDDPITGDTRITVTAAEALHRQIVDMRAELEALRLELATEVRTTRLVVVHPDDGRELVYTERLEDSIGLHVAWLADDAPNYCRAVLAAGDECGGEASMYVVGAGNVSGSLDVHVTTAADGSSKVSTDLTLDSDDWSKPDATGKQRKESDRPYLRIDPIAGVTLRQFHHDIRGQVRFEVPMGGAS